MQRRQIWSNKHMHYRKRGTSDERTKRDEDIIVLKINSSAACNTRLIIADKLLEKFTLSDEEIRRLCSSTVPVDEEFFVALDHLQQIYHDCRLLLMTQNQQAGYMSSYKKSHS